MRRLVLAGIVAFAALPAAASEQEIGDCLSHGTDAGPEACIGIIADPCLETPEGQSTHGMVACIGAETEVWDGMLNADYARLMEMLDPAQQAALREAQRAWIASRDLDCAMPHVIVDGTMAQPWGASCLMDATARRVLWLRGFLDFMGQ